MRRGDEYLGRVISLASRTVMNRLIGDYSIDEVLTEKRNEIRVAAKEQTQKMLDGYKCGVIITDLQMQRVRPPRKVRPAFDAVNKSIQERDKLENEANKIRNKQIPEARAAADKKMRDAEGYAARRRAEVGGEIKALRARYEAYRQAPEVTRKRLYLDAMEEILSRSRVQDDRRCGSAAGGAAAAAVATERRRCAMSPRIGIFDWGWDVASGAAAQLGDVYDR